MRQEGLIGVMGAVTDRSFTLDIGGGAVGGGQSTLVMMNHSRNQANKKSRNCNRTLGAAKWRNPAFGKGARLTKSGARLPFGLFLRLSAGRRTAGGKTFPFPEHETYVSALQTHPETAIRIPEADEHQKWPRHHSAAAEKRPQTSGPEGRRDSFQASRPTAYLSGFCCLVFSPDGVRGTPKGKPKHPGEICVIPDRSRCDSHGADESPPEGCFSGSAGRGAVSGDISSFSGF